MIRFENYQSQSEWGLKIYSEGMLEGERTGRLTGRLEGEADALMVSLHARGLSPGPELRERITRCRELNTLRQWLRRAATADRLAEVFDG